MNYLINDVETRMKLLAGFIDTDGCLKMNNNDTSPRYEISQSERLHGNMIDELNFLSKSLGFSTSITYNRQNNKKTKPLSVLEDLKSK
jgi:hypothetical protein